PTWAARCARRSPAPGSGRWVGAWPGGARNGRRRAAAARDRGSLEARGRVGPDAVALAGAAHGGRVEGRHLQQQRAGARAHLAVLAADHAREGDALAPRGDEQVGLVQLERLPGEGREALARARLAHADAVRTEL